MTDPSCQRERRSEIRHYGPASRISWIKENETGTCTGWMNDVASSGVAFVTPTRDQPSPGEEIELVVEPNSRSPQCRQVRVVRITPFDRFFSTVACRAKTLEEAVST